MHLARQILVVGLVACGPQAAAIADEAHDQGAEALAASPVRLVWADGNIRCGSCGSMRAVIEVANLGYEKNVVLVYSADGGPWHESPSADYLRSVNASTDLFLVPDLPGLDLQFSR